MIRGAVGVGGLKLLALPLSFAGSILLARGLGPDGFGQYAFVMSLVALLSLPIARGMPQLMTREVANYHHGAEWGLLRGLLRRANQWVLLASLLIGGVLGSIAAHHATWQVNDRWTLLLVGLISLPFLGLNAVRVGTLRGLGNVVVAQLPELLVQPGLHLVIVAGLLGFGALNAATGLLSQAAAASVAFAIGAYLLHQRQPPEISASDPQYRSSHWGRAWVPFTLIMAAGVLNNQIGILLLGFMSTSDQVAALRVADRGAQLVVISLGIINMVIAPHIARAHQEGLKERLQQLSRQSARAVLLIAAPIAIPLIFFGGPIVHILFGAEYVALTVVPLAVLAAAQLVNAAFGSVGLFLVMSGFERETLIGQGVALAINIVAAVGLIPAFGAAGAAAAAAIGMVTWNLVLGIRVLQRLNLRPGAF